MPLRDDDEDEALSTRAALERADHRKSEKREEVNKKKDAQKSREKLKRDLLGKQIHGSVILQKDGSVPQTFGLKTIEEKSALNYQPTANQTVDQEQLMAAEEESKKADEESKQEDNQASPG